MSASVELQRAIYDILAAAPLGVVGIYDNPTQVEDPSDNSLFPFITIGDTRLDEFDTDDIPGFNVEVLIHTWSRAHHHLEAKGIQDEIYAALNRVEPVLASYLVYDFRQQMQDVQRDPDGITIHGVSQFTGLLQTL